MEKARILCVEHTAADRNILCAMLRESGYDAVPASSGSEALEVVQQQQIHGVLLDYDLPDKTGATVREEIIKLFPDLPVLLFSGVGQHTPFLLRFLYQYLDQPNAWEATARRRAGAVVDSQTADQY